MLKQGSELRAGFIEEAKQRKQLDQQELEKLKVELAELEQQRLEKEAVKKAAEEKEKAALDRHQAEQDAKKKAFEEAELAKAQEAEKRAAITAFAELDTDQNGILTYQEIQAVGSVFDQNNDGVVADDEAKFFLHAQESMVLNDFIENGWIIIKPHYLKWKVPPVETSTEQTGQFGQPEVTPAPKGEIEEEEEVFDEEERPDVNRDELLDHEREDDDDSEAGRPFDAPEPPVNIRDSGESEYDEETKKLVEESRKASQEYMDIESKFRDVQGRLNQLETTVGTDFGPDDSFMALLGKCFELTDREYTYKLCPFDRASQRSKDGGSETSLG